MWNICLKPYYTNPRAPAYLLHRYRLARVMGRIIYTISVPEHSVADSKLKQWRHEGANISALVCLLIEEEGSTVDHLEAMKKKIQHLKELTDGGRAMEKDDWEIHFGMW